MLTEYEFHGIQFEWDSRKSEFETKKSSVLYRQDQSLEVKGKNMKSIDLKKRLNRNRPMNSVTIRIPKDVIEDLKRIAPQLGFSGYQPLIRAYIGQGLRQDLARLEGQLNVEKFINSLRKHGVDKTTIDEAISEAG
jgi:predicted DNA binding CopG/RHH family protein